MLADMIIVRGDPLADIGDLTRIDSVILNGRRLKLEALTESL